MRGVMVAAILGTSAMAPASADEAAARSELAQAGVVGVARHPERVALHDLQAGEQRVQVGRDHLLKPHEAPDAVRVALGAAPRPGLSFVSRASDGTPVGVTADLAADCARALGARPAFTLYPNTGAATEAVRSGAVDVSFMPVDAARRALVAFGPATYDLESTYLVTAASGLRDVADVDRAGVRVVAIAGTTTLRASERTLTKTRPVAVTSVGEGIAALREGRADALALSRDTLAPIVAAVPGSRIATGGFQRTQVAVAVAKDHPRSLAFVTAWLDGAKRDGTVARVFAAHGFGGQAVAAP